ncbi:hypothetical protein K1F50_00155 [Muricauda oceani]|uniref:Uncharacterized protein n=1 Tax=Flagellimonas oceani TaxID=2698672 RepID=A0A6G7J2M9_9FLAO|nr:hypothetical protein [Allomuricauda oceani]MBW8241189.1 hypothetical protein [Allomuricauda oceani]QII44804.1 hypothetical protein GVT53_08950 [Allomuricauda oceani]
MKTNLLTISLLWCCVSLWATTAPIDSVTKGKPTHPLRNIGHGQTDTTDLKQNNIAGLLQRWQKQKSQKQVSKTKFRSFSELESPNMDIHSGLWDNVAEFSPDYVAQQFNIEPETQKILNDAQKVFQIIEDEQRFIQIIGGEQAVELPVGIRQNISPDSEDSSNKSNSYITLGIFRMEYHPTYTEVDLFAKVELGELNTELMFSATNVRISKNGGIYEEASLNLLIDVPVGMGGGQWLLTFLGGIDPSGEANGQTFITINCEGKIRELSISADVRIAKTVAIPITENGKIKYPDKTEPGSGEKAVGNDSYVGANFSMHTTNIHDLLIQLDLPPFELRALPKWGFKMQNTVLDLSDTANSASMDFPQMYTAQNLLVPGNENLWRGFFAEEVKVYLPEEFGKRNSDERVSIGAQNLLLDNFGVSGDFFATNIIGIDEGNANKWQFSLDSLGVDIKVNRFMKAGFSGRIVLPISDSESSGGQLGYSGVISSNQDYFVKVKVEEDVPFNIFSSKARIFKESYINLEVEDKKFYPEANLSGIMAFDPEQNAQVSGSDEELLTFSGLKFQDLHIQTKERPYLSIGYAGYLDTIAPPEIAGFELGVYDVSMETIGNDEARLSMNSYINLDESGIHGDVRVHIFGKLEDGDYLKWKYHTTEVSEVQVDVTRKGFEFSGRLAFFRENAVYGKGFAGELDLYSESLGIEIGAQGLFGNTGEYRYWYVDAHGRPTGSDNPNFTIYDIGGGVYHHMRKSGLNDAAGSMSGIYYAPDENIGLGFKALAAFEVKKGAAFTGLVAIEMSFNSATNGGGLSRLGFYGAAALIQGGGQSRDPFGSVGDMQQQVSDKEASLSNFHELSIDREGIQYFVDHVFPEVLTGEELFAAQVAIDFDFENRTYWGMFDVFLNAGPIKGAGEKNRLGYLEFYNAPEDWYIYVGTPYKRFGLQGIPIGPLTAKVDLYFMTGTILPDPARPPQNVIDILNLKGDELLFGRNFDQNLTEGAGYAFGASFSVGKEIDWGIVYASVRAGVGFDLMLRDFGDAHCLGKSGPLGMDGWYATGQLYAYLQGEIGAQVKLFGMRKRVPILKAGLAVLAQAQLPNPWFIRGYAGIDVKVLGVVSIRTRLKVTIGEECEIVGKSGIQDIVMISDVMPGDGYRDVDVFDAVQVAFNAPMESELRIQDDEGWKTYRVHLDDFIITNQGNPIEGAYEFNQEQDLLVFKSFEILPPEEEIYVKVKVGFQQKIGNSWIMVREDGKPIIEEKEVTFTTGTAPTYIPRKNIKYMYPVVDQKYMLPKESNQGYVQLHSGQEYLFGNGYKDELYFLDESGNKIKADFQYIASQKRLNFSIPNLKNETTYTYALITLNPSDVEESLVMTQEEFSQVSEDLEISTNSIVGSAKSGAFISRLNFSFTTSRHDTFKEKMNAMKVKNTITYLDGYQDSDAISNVARMSLIMEEYEPFSIEELVGTVYTQNTALIKFDAVLDDEYYKKDIYSLVYAEYPLDGDLRVQRNTAVLGIPPKKSIQISSNYVNYQQTDDGNNFLNTYFPYRWHLPITYYSDFKDLQYQVSNRYLVDDVNNQVKLQKYEHIMWGRFPFIRQEKYRVRFSYVLPNKSSGNSQTIIYKNSL